LHSVIYQDWQKLPLGNPLLILTNVYLLLLQLIFYQPYFFGYTYLGLIVIYF